MNPQLLDLIGVFVGFTLTLATLSYLIGDNPLFRLASHIFIGVSAGYVTVVMIYNVIWLRMILPVFQTGNLSLVTLLAAFMGVWMLSARSSAWGRPVMAFLVGTGAAVALGGALLYTVIPQIEAAATPSNWMMGLIALVGTATTLVYFNFHGRQANDLSIRRQWWVEGPAWLGHFFVAVTFGVLFAGVYGAALTVFVDRMKAVADGLWMIYNAIPLR